MKKGKILPFLKIVDLENTWGRFDGKEISPSNVKEKTFASYNHN